MKNQIWTYVILAFFIGFVVAYSFGMTGSAVIGSGLRSRVVRGVCDVNGDCVSGNSLDLSHNFKCEDCDFNNDGKVDTLDFSELFVINYGNKNCAALNLWCDGTDINENGKVDINDFVIFSNHYSEECRLLKPIGEYTDCSDTDGKNYYYKGVCSDKFYGQYTDFCAGNTNKVVEFYCSYNASYGYRICDTVPYNCPNGCRNGACLRAGVNQVLNE